MERPRTLKEEISDIILFLESQKKSQMIWLNNFKPEQFEHLTHDEFARNKERLAKKEAYDECIVRLKILMEDERLF